MTDFSGKLVWYGPWNRPLDTRWPLDQMAFAHAVEEGSLTDETAWSWGDYVDTTVGLGKRILYSLKGQFADDLLVYRWPVIRHILGRKVAKLVRAVARAMEPTLADALDEADRGSRVAAGKGGRGSSGGGRGRGGQGREGQSP